MTEIRSTKELLIAAATRLIDNGGPEALTLRAVAHEIGVSHNAPYKHFRDKRALFEAVAQNGFREMRSSFKDVALAGKSPLDALRLVVVRYLDFAEQYPARYKLLFSDPEIAQEQGPLEAEAMQTFEDVCKLVRAAQELGQVKPGEPSEITALLYGTIHGLIDLRMSGRTKASKSMDDIRAICMLQVDLLVR